MADPRTCPDELELLALARGTISPERGAALRDHIGDCAACRSVVASLASMPADGSPGTPGPDPARYELQRLLGAGGMGEVFLAQDRVLGRLVAIKLLHDDGAGPDPGALERVSREARALASLADPNVIAVYDRGVLDGRPFLAMEYVRGRTLRQWVTAEKPELARVVDVLVQAGRGLAAAHEIGVVHRDFKPDNVLVGDDGRARVTDFGLARALPEADVPETSVVGTFEPAVTHGALAGTPAYSAPERLRGASADARSDQYSFCVTAYESIHGRRPSEAPAGDRPRSSAADRRLGPIDAVLARGLSPEPADRFASMREVLRELEDAARPRRQGRRFLLIAAGSAIGVAVIATVLVLRHGPTPADAAPIGLHAACGGTSGDCQSPLVCKYREGNFCGASGAPGTCGWPADDCNANSPSVCGCDGVTYGNQCKAHQAGVPTAYRGDCVECSAAEPCADLNAGGKRAPAFCHVAASATPSTSAASARGVCWPGPAECGATGSVVCGWDGTTYDSLCEARRSGVDSRHEGPCVTDAPRSVTEITGPPPIAAGGLSSGFPDEQGMDARPLIALAEWIEREKLPIFSLLVSRNGVLVLELYTSSMTRDQANYVMGATTALTSALVGVAIDRHLVAGPEQSVLDALPPTVFPDAVTRERFRAVTIRDVLGMSALDAPVPPRDTSDASRERSRRLMASRNRTKLALAQPLLPRPGVSFQYTDFTPQIATGILSYTSGKSALELAESWLFGPMGFRSYEWLYQDAAGIDDGAAGLRLRPIDMHKLGVLYLRQGLWEGQRLLSQDWVTQSFTPWIRASERASQPNYGFYWYAVDFGKAVPAGARRTGAWTAHLAQGWKGQRIAVFVDEGVVVTMTAVIEHPEDETDIFRRIIGDYVAPSIDGVGAEPPHPDAGLRATLASTLERLRTEPLLRTDDLEPRLVPSVEPKERHHAFRPD
jgi:CubicO group peptidase (beta-lactamase class C family)/predicted Ser/Thr protein kinase